VQFFDLFKNFYFVAWKSQQIRTAVSTAIRRTLAWETGVSRHHGRVLIEGPFNLSLPYCRDDRGGWGEASSYCTLLAVVNPIEDPLNPSLPYCRDDRGCWGEATSYCTPLAVVNPIEEPLNPSLPYCRDVRGVSGEVESCTSDRSSSALIILYRSMGKLSVNTLPWIVSISTLMELWHTGGTYPHEVMRSSSSWIFMAIDTFSKLFPQISCSFSSFWTRQYSRHFTDTLDSWKMVCFIIFGNISFEKCQFRKIMTTSLNASLLAVKFLSVFIYIDG